MVSVALAAEAADIAVPLVTKAVIDGAIAHHERGLLLPLGLLAVALGAASASLSLIRRWVQGNAVAGMEKAIRDDMYAHLQRLEPAFHDEWQSGQLLSRATTDLGTIRRFMGFGIVFLFISTMTFTAVSALLLSLNWWLGLITMAMFVPVFVFCLRFEKKYKVLARRAQDQDGDLTTLVEEAATGVRVLKALGRAPEAAGTHYAQADLLSRTRVAMAGVVGWFWSVLTLVPNAVIALAVVLGAVAVSRHAMTVGGLVAFITLGLQLVWPVEALGYILASGEEAATAAQRVVEIFDTEPAITSDAAPDGSAIVSGTPSPGGAGHGADPAHHAHVLFDDVSFSYPGDRNPVLSAVSLKVARGETLVLTGCDGLGEDHAALPGAEARRRVGRPGAAGRDGRAGHPPAATAPAGRLRLRGGDAVLRLGAGERHVRRGGRDHRRDRGGAARGAGRLRVPAAVGA